MQYECTRVPVTASASYGPLYVAAEGPFLRLYNCKNLHYLESNQVFQAQAIHGIACLSETINHVTLVIWGGFLVRTVDFDLIAEEDVRIVPASWLFSEVFNAPDWILDLSPAPSQCEGESTSDVRILAAVTAHNALLELTATRTNGIPVILIAELSSSSRSILYSAHLLWESPGRVLVAAGTAFGEIMYWSWTRRPKNGSKSQIHSVFLGHEGSIFGVQISKELSIDNNGHIQRLLASCSDDRTIRIWDVSNVSSSQEGDDLAEELELERTQHTGFTNASFDIAPSSSACLAIGWGHISRVWSIQFLALSSATGVFLLSSGEDATSRTWHLTRSVDEQVPNSEPLTYKLLQLDSAAYHSGKNIWSSTVPSSHSGPKQVIYGGADSKIIACSLGAPLPQLGRSVCVSSEYTVTELASPTEPDSVKAVHQTQAPHKSSKMAEFFRSYAFINDSSYLLTTNFGKVYLGSTILDRLGRDMKIGSHVTLVDQPQDLNGYSICTGIPSLGLVFVAGSQGSIYVYRKDPNILSKLSTITGKVVSMFAVNHQRSESQGVLLLITVTGQDIAQLLDVTLPEEGPPSVSRVVLVPTTEVGPGLTITSMGYVSSRAEEEYLFLGFRQGSIAVYRATLSSSELEDSRENLFSLINVLERVHQKETVTSLYWLPAELGLISGHLISTGRDGRVVIHTVDFQEGSISLVHNLALPVGPNIEGLYFSEGHLLIYGFSSKNFVLYDTDAEEELMGVDTGGAHRSWTFEPSSQTYGGGTLVWTRASNMHICHQPSPSHQAVRAGGHGREIKAVAVSLPISDTAHRQLIATGAEDTDIKIFEYMNGELICRRTLRKHRTGIQHLQWSVDGEYLFSSGGCEEFYIWRVRALPAELGGIGVVCESVCRPESEHADLRLMSFDVTKRGSAYVIAMVFSDSNIRVSRQHPNE
jgi:WD40 repeat protein